jgi:hypothetical protein
VISRYGPRCLYAGGGICGGDGECAGINMFVGLHYLSGVVTTYAEVHANDETTADTGPMFNPSEAPFFGPSGLVYPTETQEPLLPPTITDYFSVVTTMSLPLATLSRSSTAARNSTFHSASRSVTSSARSSSTTASRTSLVTSSRTSLVTSSRTSLVTSSSQHSSATSASATPIESAGAAARYHGVVGAVVGGLFAGLAMA